MAENTDNTIDPKAPPLPKGYEPIKKEVNSVPPLPPGYIPLKKKESTVLPSTTTPSNSDLGGAMDSSDTSNNNGFPKIDTNSLAPGMGIQPKGAPSKKEKKGKVVDYQKPKEDDSFFEYLKENLYTGLATVSKSIYDAPGMVYDAAAFVTNPVAELFGADKSQLASSDKLAKYLGIRNIPSDVLKKKISESNEKINAYSAKNGRDALSALENGNYSGAAKMIAGTTVQSLPIMAAAMVSGGSAGAMTAIGVSTASTKNAELKDEYPEMSMGTRLKNAATSGVLEATLGQLFTGASGSVVKKILADKGVEAGSRIISNSFRSTIEKSIAKSPLAGAFGEMVEESAVEFGNQLNDIDSGIRTEFDVRAIKNAGLSATGMGGLNTVGIYGAKAYVKNKDYQALKSVNKEIDKLSTELDNENISPENKEIIASRIDRLVTENKRILGTELEKLKSLPTEVKSELNTINNNLSEIRSKADDIKEDNSIDPEIKKKLLQELNIQSKNAGKRKLEILNSTKDVVVNADLSNFEGVDPDFNLTTENQENDSNNETSISAEAELQTQVQEQASTEQEVVSPNELQDSSNVSKNQEIVALEAKRDAEIEALKAKRQYDEKNISPIREKYEALILKEKSKETDAKIKNKELFKDGGSFSNQLGESGVDSVATNHTEINGIEFVQFSNPNTGVVDVIMSGTSDSDFVGYYRIYENGKPTDKWSSKFENQSRNKENFKTMISGVQSMLPENHEYTEKTSISTDGLRVWEQQLNRGYEIQTDENGNIVTNEVAINGDAINNELGIDVNQGNFDNISVNNNQQFESVKKALLPYLKKLGLNETNVKWENGTVIIDLPILRKKSTNEATPTSNTPTDGNVSVGAIPMVEAGISEQEANQSENVQSTVDGGEGKGDVEVGKDFNEDDIANFLNGEFGAKKPVETPKAEVVKPKKEVVLKQEKVAQAKGFVSLAVNKLTTSLKDFQGRAKEYSQQTYDRIVNEAKEGKLNISSIPPIQIWNNPDTGKFVILAGHSRTKAFADLADGKVAFSEKYKKSDFTNVNAQIVEAETLDEAQKIAKESNQGAVQTVVDNAKYVRESLLPTFSNKNQAKTKLRALYGASWARIYAYANLNPKGKAMQMLKQFENANEGTSDDSSKRIAEWTGKARSDFEQLTDAHENEIFDHLLKNDKVKTYEEFSQLLNNRVNGLEQFDANEPLNFESKVGRGSNEVEVLKEIQDFKNREAEIKKSIKKLQANGKQITDSQRQEIRNLTAEAIKINTVDIPNAQKKQKQAKEADANQFDIFSQINEQIENGNITPEQVDEFVNDDRKAAEIEPIVEAIEIKAKSDKKAELEEVVAEVEAVVVNKPKLTESERIVRNHKNRIYQNPKDGYYYQVTGYNSGYFTIKDAETGKVSKEKEVDFENNFIDVTDEVEKQNLGITSESSGFQNGTGFDVTQYQDNVFEIKDFYDKNAPTYKVVVGNAFDLDSSTITKEGKPLRKNERLPQGALIAIQNHVERFNPESKVREINKFLGREANKPIPVMAEDTKKPKPTKIEVADNENVPAAYHENFKKEFPNTLLAIEEKNGMITIFEDGKSREIEGHKFFDELKQAIANGYKGIGKVTRKAVETESKKLLANAKIDKVAKVIKKATKADINPDDYHNNGFAGNQDKLIDLIADAAKKLVSAKIDLDEAIRQVIESIKAKFGEIDIDIEAIKEKINPKVEEEKKSEPKKSKSKESSKDMEDFRDSWNKDPNPSGEINQYDSGNTIKREHGELRNNQDYEVQKDLSRVQIGIKAIEHAKRLFGAEYVEKTLSFIEQANLSPEKKAVAYVLLENEMDARAKEFPDNVGVKKLQDLVRAKSQAFLANSARAMGAGRFRIERFRELAKNGFSEEELTNAILTTQQIKDKEKIQKLSQVTPDDINAEADMQESHVVDSDLEQLISEGVEKQLNEIYKKLPTSRRVRADKAISALENIQKKLRGKAYDATIGVPIAIIDSGITIIKNSIKAGVNIADAIEIGINHIKSKYGKDWKKEDDFRKDMRDGFEEEGVNVKDKAPKEISQEQKAKDLVKKALIDAGFSREITVRNKNGKDKRNVLDWKKLAGEAGTIDNIRKNVEESLKNSDYSKSEIEAMKDALEKEYVRLTADVIEKGLNELQNRNAPRKPINTKSAARKLAELHNYGLFEKNKDSYEKIINYVLGVNELDQKAFEEMKHIAKGYAVLMDSGLSETETKDAINSLSRRQSRLVDILAFSQASWRFKLAVAFREITNLSIRFKLVNLGNLAENISSGMMARASNRMIDAMANIKKGEKTSNKALRNQSKTNARAKLKGITLEASESYGDTSSLLLNHSAVEDYFNNSTTNKVYHAIISTYMAKPVLEGADSFNKILITEAKMVRATIKVLQAKGMTNKDALDYVAKALTGESMKEAIVKSKNLILEVNNKSGKKLLNDSESAVQSLASDIVKESLVSGGQITETELKAIYNAAYKSAGKDIGHVSNNWVTDWISAKGAQIEKRVADAIKEKKWNVAAGEVVNQWIWKSFISTFVGGGTNWFIKGLQKSSNPLSLISLREDSMRLKMAGKLDVTTDEGIKNMEEVLYRGMNLRSTGGSMIMGAIITASIISSMMATGADDELAEWLKNNPWAKKFFDKLVPDAVVLMLAINDKDYWRYIAKTINVKADFFDDQKNIAKILTKYAEGRDEDDAYKTAEASGDLGVMLGKRFDFPGPLRAVKDAKQIYKGAVKGKYDETDYYTSGFLNGFFQGGIVEGLGLRKDPTLENKKSTKGIMEGRLHPKRKTAEEKRESRRTREENERELMKKAREEGVRYVPPRR